MILNYKIRIKTPSLKHTKRKSIKKEGVFMFILIAFLLVLIGCANWLTIGLLQFDFVAGLFGSQSNIFSRIVYVIIGVSAVVIVINVIKNKGRIGFNFKKFKLKKSAEPLKQESSSDFSKSNYENPQMQNSQSQTPHNDSYIQNSGSNASSNTQNNNYSPQNHPTSYNQPNTQSNKNNLKSISEQLNSRHNYNKSIKK